MHSAFLHPDDIVEHGGIRYTKVIRTLSDIAHHHGTLAAVTSIDAARSRWTKLTVDVFEAWIAHRPRFCGVQAFRDALKLSSSLSGSPLESRARLLLQSFPEVSSIIEQHHVVSSDGDNYYLDFLINGCIALEIDGMSKYNGTYGINAQAVILAERDRERTIQNMGYYFIRATYSDMVPDDYGEIRLHSMIRDAVRATRGYRPRAR